MSNPDSSALGTYMDDNGLAIQAAAAVANDDRSQSQLAEDLGVTPPAISQAINPDYEPGQVRRLRIRLIETLMPGTRVRGPLFRIEQT